MHEENDAKISTEEVSKDKKIKNLISLVILLGGLLIGSLFVDVAQLIRGGGFSFGRLAGADVFQSGGKTWVSYSDPIINVKIVNDENCEACKPDEALLGLQRILPTLLTQKIDQNSPEGQKMIADFETPPSSSQAPSQDPCWLPKPILVRAKFLLICRLI